MLPNEYFIQEQISRYLMNTPFRNKLYVDDAEVQVDDNDLVEIAVTQTSATIKVTKKSLTT